jgi:hypothetical protein
MLHLMLSNPIRGCPSPIQVVGCLLHFVTELATVDRHPKSQNPAMALQNPNLKRNLQKVQLRHKLGNDQRTPELQSGGWNPSHTRPADDANQLPLPCSLLCSLSHSTTHRQTNKSLWFGNSDRDLSGLRGWALQVRRSDCKCDRALSLALS